jgi:hypothetical protein
MDTTESFTRWKIDQEARTDTRRVDIYLMFRDGDGTGRQELLLRYVPYTAAEAAAHNMRPVLIPGAQLVHCPSE